MSRIILDDQLSPTEVFVPLSRWTTARFLRDLRPGEVIKDERVPLLLSEARGQTFVTIDSYFWNRRLRNPRYCILYFPLRNEEQSQVPTLLRRVFALAPFRTRFTRMGIVARVSMAQIDYWRDGDEQMRRLPWSR